MRETKTNIVGYIGDQYSRQPVVPFILSDRTSPRTGLKDQSVGQKKTLFKRRVAPYVFHFVIFILIRLTGLSKYCKTCKITQRYYTLRCLISHVLHKKNRIE